MNVLEMKHNQDLNWDRNRYEALKNRLIDELTHLPLLQILTITAPSYEIFKARNNNVLSWHAAIEQWLIDGTKFRTPGRDFNEPPLAEKIETALEKYFFDVDAERAKQPPSPRFVLTSIAKHVIAKLQKARNMQDLIEISVLPGHGKTTALTEYQNQCRKNEGFNCAI